MRVLAATGLAAVAALIVTKDTDSEDCEHPFWRVELTRRRGHSDSNGTDLVMAQIIGRPGGSSGWHSHPGGAIIVVRQGTPTVYRAIGSQCQSTTYSAGDAFIERPGEVDDVLNAGAAPSSSTSPSRVCLPAAPRESTGPTPAPARVSDDLKRERRDAEPDQALTSPDGGGAARTTTARTVAGHQWRPACAVGMLRRLVCNNVYGIERSRCKS